MASGIADRRGNREQGGRLQEVRELPTDRSGENGAGNQNHDGDCCRDHGHPPIGDEGYPVRHYGRCDQKAEIGCRPKGREYGHGTTQPQDAERESAP